MDYGSNSHKSKELEAKKEENIPEQKLEKIVTKNVTMKRNIVNRVLSLFFETDIDTVKDYVIQDVFIPKIKELVYSLATDGLNMWMFQGKKPSGTRINSSSSITPVRVSYNKYYDQGKVEEQKLSVRPKPWFDSKEVIFDNRSDAEEVLDTLKDILERCDAVSILDFADLTGLDLKWTGTKYGWTNLNNTSIEPAPGGGYYIKLPRPIQL